MLATLFLSVCGWAQDSPQAPPLLTLEKVIEGSVVDRDNQVHSPILDLGYSSADSLGKTFQFTAPTSAWYQFELSSSEFDAFLILRDASQAVLMENDDGLGGTNSSAMIELSAEQSIQIQVCALHGDRGKFTLSAQANPDADAIKQWQIDQALFMDGRLVDLYNLDQAADAIPFAKQALELRIQAFGGDHIAVANSYGNLGTMQMDIDDFAGAYHSLDQALKLTRANMPANDLMLATPLFNFATLLDLQGKLDEAASAYAELLQVLDLYDEAESEIGLLGLFGWGEALHHLGRYSEAADVFQRLHDLTKQLPEASALELALLQGRIGLNLGLNGQEDLGIEKLERAKEVLHKVAGRLSAESAEVESYLGVLLTTRGDYDRALEESQNALLSTQALYGKASPEASTILNNLATLYQSQGDLEKAIPLLEECLRIALDVYGEVHPHTATSYNNLGMVWVTQGAPDDAIPYLLKAWELRRQTLAPDHPDHVLGMINLGLAYRASGDMANAELYFNQAIAFTEKHFGDLHVVSIRARAGLAMVYFEKGEFEVAEVLMRQAWQVSKQVLGDRHPSTLSAAQNVAAALLAGHEAEAAKEIYQATLQDLRALLGATHPETIRCQLSYADSMFSIGEFGQALPHYLQAHRARSDLLNLQFPTMSESARFQYLATWPSPEDLLDCAGHLQEKPMFQTYSTFLDWKGKATRSQRASRLWIRESASKENRSIVAEIQSLDHQIKRLVFDNSEATAAQVVEQVTYLRQRRLGLETELNRQSGLEKVFAQPNAEALQQTLTKQTALLDFYAGDETFVWIIRSQGQPTLVRLGATIEIQKHLEIHLQNRLNLTRISRGGRSLTPITEEKDQLFELLWKPIQPYLQGVENILISPDGIICELPFAILQTPEKKFLLEQFQISYLADVPNLAKMESTSRDRQGELCLIGNVNYFEAEGFEDVPLIPTEASGRIHERWVSLPGTQMEIQAIQDLIQYVLKWDSPVVQLKSAAATESAVRELLPQMRYLHFATHGFFEPEKLPSLMANGAELSKITALGAKQKAVGMLPGLLSGLVLAGANQQLPAGVNDAYLSAEEVSFLDLSKCELAVLSACETALGSSRAGNGLMSLRRSFEVAGAKSVLSSLWKVGDKESADLMVDFYQYYWEQGMGKAEALRAAQLKMMNQHRGAGVEPQPASWGAFVLSGNWN